MNPRDRPILVVEDSPDDEELTLMALEHAQISNPVQVARDGVEALACLFGTADRPALLSRPALVLLDLMLPRLNGFDVLKAIRERAPERLYPVVVLSSSDTEQDVLRAYRLGATSYVKKHVDSDRYARVVGEVASYWLRVNCPAPG